MNLNHDLTDNLVVDKKSNLSFLNLCNNFINSDKNIFYWCKPDEKFSLLAIDEYKKFASYSELLSFINSFPKGNNNPLVMFYSKFPSKDDPVWNNFNEKEFFIPGAIYIKRNSDIEFHNYSKIDYNIIPFENSNKTEILNITSNLEVNDWENHLEFYLNKIISGEINKVVASRYNEIQFTGNLNFEKILSELEEKYPECYIYLLKRNNSIFFGASPEMFLRKKDNLINLDALAGSAEPKNLEMLYTEKNKSEHDYVIDYIMEILSKYSYDISLNGKYNNKLFSNVVHLHTNISAKLNVNSQIFDLIDELHPTPALSGYPKLSALELIEKNENWGRGLFGGLIGWFDVNLNCDIAVGIRSGVINADKIRIYAGCGIVNYSNPTEEFKETEIKLSTLKSVLTNDYFG